MEFLKKIFGIKTLKPRQQWGFRILTYWAWWPGKLKPGVKEVGSLGTVDSKEWDFFDPKKPV